LFHIISTIICIQNLLIVSKMPIGIISYSFTFSTVCLLTYIIIIPHSKPFLYYFMIIIVKVMLAYSLVLWSLENNYKKSVLENTQTWWIFEKHRKSTILRKLEIIKIIIIFLNAISHSVKLKPNYSPPIVWLMTRTSSATQWS